MKNDLKKFKKRLKELECKRRSWESHWQELTEYLLPRRGRFLGGTNNISERGKKKHNKIKKSVAKKAINTLASGMQGGLTSPSRTWFRLRLPNDKLMELEPVKLYLSEVEEILYHVFAKSNLYDSLYSTYEELCVYGVSAMIIEEDFKTVIHCRPLSIGEYFIGLDSRNRPDSLYRRLNMTASQLIEEFSKNKVSENVRNTFDEGRTEDEFLVIHAIQPKNFYDKDKKDERYVSVYWEEKNNNGKFLREAGYSSQPFMSPRWNSVGGDVYGESPAMEALGDIKEVQKITDLKLEGIEKEVRPPWLADSSLRGKINANPNAITYITSQQASAGLQPLFKYQGNLANIRAEINEIVNDIRQTFYNDLFLSITSQTKQMTATEVAERKEEKMLMLGQVIERLESELLDMIIDRTFEIMNNLKILPQPPQEIQGNDIKIEYVSLLSQAQKMAGVSTIQQLTGFVSQVATVNPDILDKVDFDSALDKYAEMIGAPAVITRSNETVAELRSVRQQQMQQAQQQQQMQQMTDGAKKLSDTKLGEGNALEAVIKGMGNNGQ